VSTPPREPGTYRTRSGILVHFRALPDGTVALEPEDDRVRGRVGGAEQLVKLSDDPDWPDVSRPLGDLALFAD
jgi:hypothetical protein